MEKASLDVDKKNMKSDMDRLTSLGLELRKQSQSLSEAQHVVVQERMKNEMLKNDIKEFHSEVTKTTGSTMDDAAMQLHMAKKRHANAEMHMALARKTYAPTSKAETKVTASTSALSSWTTNQKRYPAAPSFASTPATDQSRLHSLSAAQSSKTIQKELQRIEDEFKRRSHRT